MMYALVFVLGSMFGGTVGVMVMCLMEASKNGDI